MDISSVKGKVAIVTGGAAGIGLAISKVFCSNGMKVVIADRNVSKGEAAVAAINAEGGEASFISTDVTSDASIKACVDFVVATYGRLDGIVNNAGVSAMPMTLHEYTSEQYDRVMNINIKGVFLGMKYAAEAMVKAGTAGFIINIASDAGICPQPGMSLYSGSKFAVVGMTRTAALDYAASNLTVNAICPGMTSGGHMDQSSPDMAKYLCSLCPPKRMAKPEEHGYLALFLASDMARYINGAIIPVDGGMAAGLPHDFRLLE